MRYFNFALSNATQCYTVMLLALIFTGCASHNESDTANSVAKQMELKSIAKALVDEADLANTSPVILTTKEQIPSSNSFKVTEQSLLYQLQRKQMQQNISSNIEALYQRALLLMKAQEWQQAEKLFAKIISLAPELSGSYLNQAIIAKNQQQIPLAQEKINQALAINPINPYAHNLNGILARQRGDFNLAEQSYLMALESMPDYADAHLNLAILAELYEGKWFLAQQHYQAYLLIRQDDKQVQRWLAGLTLKLAQKSQGE